MINYSKLKSKVMSLPDSPGVYIFMNALGAIIYIGKAKSLKKRVQSYFNRPLSAKTQAMVSKIADLEYRLTSSESQAQLLEASLIKEKMPPYNVSLKDDKSFPLIKITDEAFPIVSICRSKNRSKEDAALYFGPYTSAQLLRQALKMIRQVFGFRSCKILPKKVCLYGRIKLCPEPCSGKITSERYKGTIIEIKMFLEARYEELLNKLYDKMKKAAQEEKFEEAAKARDQINALGVIGQNITSYTTLNALEVLQSSLHLDRLPIRIEAFDISNISGKEATGAMVSFQKGLPDKNNYRRFRIKTIEAIDDYSMLREVIRRRYLRLIQDNSALPDLILIDGGKGHLLAAADEITQLGIKIPLISIAKERENIYTTGRINALKLRPDSAVLNLIRRIRDEAHRFALAYHHVLRRKKIIGK